MIQFYLLRALNQWTENLIPPLSSLAFGFDSLIRQTPAFIMPYISVYALFALLIILITLRGNVSDMSKFLISVLLTWSVLNFLQAFFPIYNATPQLSYQGSFFDYLSQLTRPYRTLPRWHVTTAILCAIAFTKMNFRNSKYVIAWTVLICVSPVMLRMMFTIELLFTVPIPFICYAAAERISAERIIVQTRHEVVKTFTLESLIQSVVIGIRDQSTISSLIEGLARVEKSLSENDKEEIKEAGKELSPRAESLKKVINDLILSIDAKNQLAKARQLSGKDDRSYTPMDSEIKAASGELINSACEPFQNAKFRDKILELKRRNSELMNTHSVEEGARDRSEKVIRKFQGFIETNKKNIPALEAIVFSRNGHIDLSLEEIKTILSELRKPPYELSADEIWNAYYRKDSRNVIPVTEFRIPANIIYLIQFASGKIKKLEPHNDIVERKFRSWFDENESRGRRFSGEETELLKLLKNQMCASLGIYDECFGETPFIEKGGKSGVYKVFGQDLDRIISEFNEKLI